MKNSMSCFMKNPFVFLQKSDEKKMKTLSISSLKSSSQKNESMVIRTILKLDKASFDG
jgi:hypothetical protein